jgi:TolB protein
MKLVPKKAALGVAALVLTGGLGLAAAPSAQSAFPGGNGLIAFERYLPADEDTDISLMNPDGTGQTPIAEGPNPAGGPVWSADGTKIVYAEGEGNDAEIWSMDADGSNKTQLTDDDDQDAQPFWSPDGTQIVYRAFGGNQYDLFVMNADGSNSVNITNTPDGGEFNPAWSPDGSRIAFGGRLDSEDDFEIWSIAPDGSNRLQLTDDDDDSAQPDWAPDGSEIVYSRGNEGTGYDLWTVDPDGSNETLLLDLGAGFNEESPVYSPDGTKIAVGVYDESIDETNIWIADADGSNPVLVNDDYSYSPSWQPIFVEPTTTTTTTVAPPTTTIAPHAPVARAVATTPRFTG